MFAKVVTIYNDFIRLVSTSPCQCATFDTRLQISQFLQDILHPPGPSTTPRRRVAKVSEKLTQNCATVSQNACLRPRSRIPRRTEEFHKGPREDPLGEGGGRSRMRGEGRRRTWSAPNVEYSAQLPCLCATFDPVEKSIRKRKSWITEITKMIVSSTRTAYFRNVSSGRPPGQVLCPGCIAHPPTPYEKMIVSSARNALKKRSVLCAEPSRAGPSRAGRSIRQHAFGSNRFVGAKRPLFCKLFKTISFLQSTSNPKGRTDGRTLPVPRRTLPTPRRETFLAPGGVNGRAEPSAFQAQTQIPRRIPALTTSTTPGPGRV